MARRRNRNRNAMMRYNSGNPAFIGPAVPWRQVRRSGMRDWLIGGIICDTTGAPQAATAYTTTWSNGAFPITIGGGGGGVTLLTAFVQPTPMTSTPGVGRLMVDKIQGKLFVHPNVSGGATTIRLFAGVGVFLSKLNNTTTIWDVRDLRTPADVARDDYYYLDGQDRLLANVAAQTAPDSLEFDLNIPINVAIGGGEAIALAVYTNVAALVSSCFRTLVGPVA